jgi:hypothetical protein
MEKQDNIHKTTLVWAAFMLGFIAVGFSIAALIITIIN